MTTDLERSKQLAPIMGDVNNYFEYIRFWIEDGNKWSRWFLQPKSRITRDGKHKREYIDCYTLTDILAKLPSYIKHKGSRYRLTIMKFNDNLYDVTYYNTGALADKESSRCLMEQEDINHKGFEQRDPTQASADLLLWCDKEGYSDE